MGLGMRLVLECMWLSFNAGVVSTLAKNEKTWVLRLCPSKLCFVISERGPVGGANIWCELSQVGLVSHANAPMSHPPRLVAGRDYEGGLTPVACPLGGAFALCGEFLMHMCISV